MKHEVINHDASQIEKQVTSQKDDTNCDVVRFTAGELAKLQLPGLPTTYRRILEKARREGWEYIKVRGRGPGGEETRFRPPPEIMHLIEAQERGELPKAQKRTDPKGPLEAKLERSLYLVVTDGSGEVVDELVRVPRHDVQVSGGAGAVVHSEQIVDWLVFKTAWIREMGLQPDKLVLVEAVGDSMFPTIKRGDLLLVDMRSISPSQESIYVIRRDDTLQVKRLQQMFTGEIHIKSDNTSYTTEVVPANRASELEIIGRVVWSGRCM